MRSARLLGLAFSLLSLVALSACDVFISADGRIAAGTAQAADQAVFWARLERETGRNVKVMWLSSRSQDDFVS